jgi:hypothetical protein
MFCGICGIQMAEDNKFCTSCGNPISNDTKQSTSTQPQSSVASQNVQQPQEEEKVFFRGEGELIVKKTEHRGAVRKVGSLLFAPATLGISYLAFGRDKTRKSKAEGTLVVTNKAIYCAGNDYPFDRILSITKQGKISKSITLTFEKDVSAGGRSAGSIAGTGGVSVEIDLKTKDIDALFQAFENAKMYKLKF